MSETLWQVIEANAADLSQVRAELHALADLIEEQEGTTSKVIALHALAEEPSLADPLREPGTQLTRNPMQRLIHKLGVVLRMRAAQSPPAVFLD